MRGNVHNLVMRSLNVDRYCHLTRYIDLARRLVTGSFLVKSEDDEDVNLLVKNDSLCCHTNFVISNNLLIIPLSDNVQN